MRKNWNHHKRVRVDHEITVSPLGPAGKTTCENPQGYFSANFTRAIPSGRKVTVNPNFRQR
jgi:hypothetical protein